ncbi:MAG: ribonuclease III [Patescibacteria group bacterium]
MEDISSLEKKIGLTFTNRDLLRQAMVHRSYLNENPGFKIGHNERLEFLGDAVLELVVTKYLYENYDNPEGELTNWRASLVNSRMLSEASQKVGLNAHLYLSKGEEKDQNGKARQYILANAFEALIGAIYLDRGLDVASDFIHRHILSSLKSILAEKRYLDPKSKFQEAAQERSGITPSYRTISEVGPDHDKHFVIGVYLGDELIAKGEGSSKQEAQVAAAAAGLETKGW